MSVDPVLVRPKERLDGLSLYPQPVRAEGVRVIVLPSLFRLPWFRRFDGYALHRAILLRDDSLKGDEDLLTHELCHVLQMQHNPWSMPLSYLRGYADNRYEQEAQAAVERSRRGR